MSILEEEVYITPDGLGRASIVRRTDKLFSVYVHWNWSREDCSYFNVKFDETNKWTILDDQDTKIYDDSEPMNSIFGDIDDARKAIFSLPDFRFSQKVK